MIYAQPGQLIGSVLDEAPAGLIGTVGVRVINNATGATVIARTTAGITEPIAGAGMYLAKLNAPEAAGTYTIFWDDGTVSPATTSSEELLVTASAPVKGLPGVPPELPAELRMLLLPILGGSYLGATYLGGSAFVSEEADLPVGVTGLVSTAIDEFIAKQGDTGPAWLDHLSYSTGDPVNLAGCIVQFVLRDLAARGPVALTGFTQALDRKTGAVSFTPTSQDTSIAGEYMAVWVVTYPSGAQLTFPTEGYRSVRVEPSLTAEAQQIVSLTEVKEYLGIDQGERVHDSKILGHIETVRSLIEEEIGPVIPTVYDEWFNGGHATIALPHKPSTGYGTKPILRLLAASEYRGPVEYDLAIIGTPSEGQIFSVQLDAQDGIVVRRSAGGGVMPFPFDPERGDQQVHLVYEAGLEQVPENVKMAAKEAIRINYRTTQSTGKGRRSETDSLESGPASLGFYLPGRCKEMLSPNRRYPSLA